MSVCAIRMFLVAIVDAQCSEEDEKAQMRPAKHHTPHMPFHKSCSPPFNVDETLRFEEFRVF